MSLEKGQDKGQGMTKICPKCGIGLLIQVADADK
jgi:hypothetical protein